ncbi:axotactin-like isoform X2 [Amphiura filiformis]|uniref:axotactin-like isoform X2 n=1 Tax=Amphiura filiformis TaxID=82378 RepID=UPI003B20FE39
MAYTCLSTALPTAGISLLFLTFVTFLCHVNCVTFSDPDNAYSQYLPNWTPDGRQGASFRFKSVRSDALLLLHHFNNRSSGEAVYNFWIELKGAKLQATHVFETFVETVTIGSSLDNDQWHSVDYSKDSAGSLTLRLNGKEQEIKLKSHKYGLAREKLSALTYTDSVVTLGGLAPSSSEMAPREFSRLLGCMEKIKFLSQNGVLQDIPVDSTVGTTDGCNNKCFTENHCQQGQCINQYYRTVCDCFDTGYEGQYCQQKGNMELTFHGQNYIQYQFNKLGQTVSRDKFRINLQFKVGEEHQAGVLFYATGSVPVETYLAVYMDNGRITVKMHTGSGDPMVTTSDTALNDDSWHKIFIRLDGRFLLVVIDDQSNSNQISGDMHQLHLDPDVYIGGGPALKGKPGLPVTYNYIGCLKEAYVDYDNLIGGVKMNSSMITFNGGTPIFECVELGHTPLTFPNKRSQLILNEWTTGELNLKFTFRTSFPDGILVHALISIDDTPDGFLNVHMVNGSLELQVDLGTNGGTNRQKAVNVGTSLHNTAWHDVHLAIRSGNILLTVDGRMVGIPHKHSMVSRSAIYLGSDVSGANTGFEGCMRQIHIQGNTLSPLKVINSDMANGVTIDGCQIALNPCASGELECENGGACTHETNGTKCTCNAKEYTGSRCQFPLFKKSCADYYRAGDRESGPKRIDVDGSGPVPAAHVMCDFSTGRLKTTIEHNFKAKTLLRSYGGPHLDFKLQYRDMTPELLAAFVKHSSGNCRQLFSYWCYESPIRLGKFTRVYGPTDNEISEYPDRFKTQCNGNRQTWQQDIGYMTRNLPITRMRVLNKKQTEFTRATLTLGPLECFESAAASKPNTVTFFTPESYLTLTPLKKSLSFIFRASAVGNVVFHQMRGDKIPNSILGYIAEENLFTFETNLNGKTDEVSVATTRSMIDGEWHTITIDINEPDILFIVDNDSEILSVPIGQSIGPFRGRLRLGGTPEVPAGKEGLMGCISAVTKDSVDIFLYDFYNEFKQDAIQPGCKSKCAKNPCKNGAQCVDKWTSYECVCAHPAQKGKNCEIDNTKDMVSFSEPTVHLEYTPSSTEFLTSNLHLSFRTYQSDALIFYANDHLHNFVQLELMDSAVLIFKYNSGRQIVEVMVDSRDVSTDDSESNSTDTMAMLLNDGAWVDVSIERDAEITVLKVNGEMMQEAGEPVNLLTQYHDDPFNGAEETVMPPRVFVSSDKVDNYTLALIGGAPDLMTSLPGLQGCIRGFMIGDEHLPLKPLATRKMQGVSTQCTDNCAQGACQNNGECTELWSSFRCNCTSTSYSGRLCSKDVGANFQSASLLVYPFTLYEDESDKSTEMDSLTFGFSTETDSGVLAYIRSDDEQQDMDKSIVVKLMDGNVEASVDFGNGPTTISIEGPFNDGYRHVVAFKRFGNRILFDVDNQDGNFTTLTDASPVQFTRRAALVAGGVEYNVTRFGLDGAGGFQGCIAGLDYNGIKPLELLFGAYAPSDSIGVSKAQCAMLKMDESESSDGDNGDGDMTSGKPAGSGSSHSRSSQSGISSEWNVKPAEGVEYVEPKKQKTKIDPEIIKYSIIAACALVILLLLVLIIRMACKLKQNDKEEEAATMEEMTPLRRKDLEQIDAAPTRNRTLAEGVPVSNSNSYTPVPREDPQPLPSQPPSQPPPSPQPQQQQPPQPQQVQSEPQVVATGQFTVEASPELKDEPPIPMIDDDVDDDEITEATPLTSNEDIPPPVPTSAPPHLTPPQPKKDIPSEDAPNGHEKDVPSESVPSESAPSESAPNGHKPLVKNDSILSESETAV